MSENMIEMNNVSLSLGKQTILSDISLTLPRGAIIGLIGANGAGKTSLLRSLAGFHTPKGDIQVLGLNPIKARSQLCQRVSYIADVATLPPWISGAQLIQYMSATHPGFIAEKARTLCKQFNLPLAKKVRQLSKGMAAQLHISLILAVNAEVLILDEPTLGLDILTRKQFYHLLLTEFFDESRTIIISSHQIEEIEKLLNHVVFIDKGKISVNQSIDSLSEDYIAAHVDKSELTLARSLSPLTEQASLGKSAFLFPKESLPLPESFDIHQPSLSDIFTALAHKENVYE